MHILGNTSPGLYTTNPSTHSLGTGSGRPRQSSPFGHLAISGKAGEEARIPVADLYPKFDQVFQGILVQSVGGNVQIDVTLANADLAINPAHDAGLWIADTTLVPGNIVKLAHFGTVIRITFVTDAILYVMGV